MDKITTSTQRLILCCDVRVTGGLQAIAELLQVDNDVTGNTEHVYNVTMRRYACMALTNLTFADGANKALLCSMLAALRALVSQLDSPSEDLCQVAASVLRNLSWHSDLASKRALREVEAAMALIKSAMIECRRETTLKSVLSALWNLSSHSADNKADICSVPGALEFLVNLLSYRSPSKTLSVIENAGGILRNVSSHVAVRDDHRAVLRRAGCLQTLLRHLRSPSLTVVSNACGTLWNLSARCAEDQSTLLQLGAVAMLKNLVHSRHRMISMGSAAALKNLLTAATHLPCVAPERSLLFDVPLTRCDATVTSPTSLPVGLHIRRQRALEDDLNRRQLSETCDDMDSPATSPSSTLRSPADLRSNSACFVSDVTQRRVQSPSPMRSAITSRHRSTGHAAVSSSHSSDEISAWDRGRALGLADRSRQPVGWSSSMVSASRDNSEQLEALYDVTDAHMTTSFTPCYDRQSSVISSSCLQSPTSQPLTSDVACSGVGSRRFLKSYACSRKPSTEPAAAMCASFLSERIENIHLDDLELKSSYDFDARRGPVSRSTSVNSDGNGQKSPNRVSDRSSDFPLSRVKLHLNLENKSDAATAAAAAGVSREDKSLLAADETSDSDVRLKSRVSNSEMTHRLDQLIQLLPQVDCTFSDDAKDVSDNQRCVAAGAELAETNNTGISADCDVTTSVLLNNDKLLGMNISTHSDVISDIMNESFPSLTQSTNSGLQSSTDVLMSDLVPDVACSVSLDTTSEERHKRLDSVNKEQTNCVQVDETVFTADDSDVLCYNSAELLSLLEENANRVVRELELKTAESTSSSEVRLLEDETISLVSGHNDNELDVDDDEDDDDYIDAISSRTYDISSASGEAACLSSRHSSSRSPSSGSNSRHSSPPATPVKTPGRPRIVKPGDDVERQQDEQSSGEVKGIRGRRKALYSVTRPKIPPATQSTTRPSSAVKSKPATVAVPVTRRPSSADTASSRSKPAVVRPVSSKPSSVNNKTAQNAPKRVTSTTTSTVPCTTSRVKPAAQSTSLKKPLTATQSNIADGKAKRRADAASSRSTVSNSRPSSSSSSNQNNKNERPTAPIKQATFVKTDQSAEDNSNAIDESVTRSSVETCNKTSASSVSAAERPAVKDRYRPSSASSVRSNKPAVSAKPAAPVRATGATAAASRVTAASKLGLRHSSPNSARTETPNTTSTVRTSQPSLPATMRSSSSSSSSLSAAALASSTARGMRLSSTASPVAAARKPVASQSQNSLKSNVDASNKLSQTAEPATAGSMLTRTSTYDKLHDADKVGTDGTDVQSTPNVSVDSISENGNEPPALSLIDSKSVVDSDKLSEVVIRRARQLVEQADQIQTRYVSPPQSIRFSSSMQPQDDVIQRPSEQQINAQPHITDIPCQSSGAPTDTPPTTAQSVDEHGASQTQPGASTSQPSTSADRSKPSPVRKFGFIGLWRRQRPDQSATGLTATDRQKQDDSSTNTIEAASPRRKTFSWWRRTASPAGTATGNKTAAVNAERAASKPAAFGAGRGTTTTDVHRPRSPTCRAAVVTPFSYRPSAPSLFADLPQSHQTKTAMLIERRMRRLKMASESSNEQTSDCLKSKPEVTPRRKNLLVTTV